MLEIVCLIWLWRVNGKNAAANGQNPGKYRIMTLALWFGMEFAGCLIGAIFMSLLFPNDDPFMGAFITGCVGAVIGGYMSYVAAKNAPKVDQTSQTSNPWNQAQDPWNQSQNQTQNPWNQNPWDPSRNNQGYRLNNEPGNAAQEQNQWNQVKNPWEEQRNEAEKQTPVDAANCLEMPATIHIISEKGGYEGCQDSFFLNGNPVCMLGPGSEYAFSTNVKKNTITIGSPVQTADDTEHCVRFIASEMGYIEIHTSAGKMLPEKFKNFK
ncbi:MAG: GlsB/YeaQ/YmgE family stress response membrane protein [Bariatricus sp.]